MISVSQISFSNFTARRLQVALKNAFQQDDILIYRRVQALILLSEDKDVAEIAEFLCVAYKTVYNWLHKFLQRGFSWLESKVYQGGGRKAKLAKKQKKELYKRILKGPESNGFTCGIWNSAMINELIFRKYGVKYNPRYLCSILKKMGLSYQKASFITDKMSDKKHIESREKWVNDRWPNILATAKKKNKVVLFGDEVSFAMWGSLGRTWGAVGKQPKVKTTGQRKGFKIFGAIDFFSGDFQYMESLSYCLKPKSLKCLKEFGMPEDLIKDLRVLKGQQYKSKEAFIEALCENIGLSQTRIYRKQLLQHAETTGRFNGETYIEFLGQLIKHFTSGIILIEDGAPYHRSAVVKEFVEKHKKHLTIERLPSFSPDFNPIEKLWKNTKARATHLKYFQTFEQLRESVLKVFKDYLEDSSKIIRVMKKLRSDAGLKELVEEVEAEREKVA